MAPIESCTMNPTKPRITNTENYASFEQTTTVQKGKQTPIEMNVIFPRFFNFILSMCKEG